MAETVDNGGGAEARPVEERVGEALDSLRPYIQQHGGDVELVRVEGTMVVVRLKGACAGCHMSLMTLKNGVENFIRERAPEIERVEAEGLTI